MDFKYFLITLKESNIKYLIKKLRNSKNIRIKRILFSILEGKDLFQAIGEECDKIGKILLKGKTIESIQEVGKYLIIREKFKKEMFFGLIYPTFAYIIFLICSFILKFYIKTIKIFTIYSLLCFPILMILSFLYFYLKIKKKFKFYIMVKIIVLFLENKISFFQLLEVSKEIKYKTIPKIKNILSVEDVIKYFLHINESSLEILKIKEESLREEIEKLFKTMKSFLIQFALLISCFLISYLIFSSLNNFHKLFE